MTSAPEMSREAVVEGALVLPRVWLLVVAGPDAGATLSSTGDRIVVGTYDTCDLVLKDSTVSRFHFEIGFRDGRPFLRDLGSLNGTSVNGVGVVAAPLVGGATLGLGRSQLRFDVGTDDVRLPLSDRTRFGGLVGRAAAMRRAFALLERAAASLQPVVVEGERGSGKKTAALALHDESARRGGPFIAVDCSTATSDSLDRALAASRGGTLYLGDVAALSMELQKRLVPTLDGVRVVAASARNLRTEVNAKRLRSELFYRLAVHEVRLPPLAERLDDVPLLVAELLERSVGRARAETLAPEIVARLGERSYPDNVAGLEELVLRNVDRVETGAPFAASLAVHLRGEERRWAAELLARAGGDEAAAARAAGVDRLQFRKLSRGDHG